MNRKDGFPNYYAAAGDVYDIVDEDTICDLSSQQLGAVPDIVNSYAICMLHLQGNSIAAIPDSFFPSLPSLMWLDLRDNKLAYIPKNIRNHQCLSHLLLQDNLIRELPNELGTLNNLKMLKVRGNPIVYPAEYVLDLGVKGILKFLNEKYKEEDSKNSSERTSDSDSLTRRLAASILIESKELLRAAKENEKKNNKNDLQNFDKMYLKREGKCPKLARTRVGPLPRGPVRKGPRALSRDEETARQRQLFLRELAQKAFREMQEARDKVLQDNKNIEMLKEWRNNYRDDQQTKPKHYRFDRKKIPFDTDPAHLSLLSREDLERDLPDKYRKGLPRRSKFVAPRRPRPGDQELANKIKQLFENLEKIDLNKADLTPRSEQKMLMGEIEKITDIKRKLSEMSHVNFKNITD